MNLAIFDIDGTLCQTSAADDRCFVQALEEVVGARNISTDWGAYEHSTDVGIASQIIRQTDNTRNVEPLLQRTHDRFIDLLRELCVNEPSLFTPTPGAVDFLAILPQRGWHIAIATGAWQTSATIKLRACGLYDPSAPAAFADDSLSREGIILTAAMRAEAKTQIAPQRIVYIGDGLWDLRAARNLQIGFVGLARGERAHLLASHGVSHLFPDFLARDEFILAIEAAQG